MLSVRHLSKRFHHAGHASAALDGISFDVAKGELFTLLGPSGCGKTTLLRMIAGLEEPDAGTIRFGDQSWADGARGVFVAPRNRGIGLVFQSYAVWPHMTVFDNIAYPLRRQRVAKAQISERVHAMLSTVGLDGLADRPALRLSGGQQQRVAMARALVSAPPLLLLDEPFSNLDVHLRHKLRAEIKHLQSHLNLTIILVTHDQEDAFALSDRIAVLSQGRIEQIATPEALHDAPASVFVHDFIGRSSTLDASVLTHPFEGRARVGIANAQFDVRSLGAAQPGTRALVRIRPADAVLSTSGARVEVLRNIVFDDRYQTLVALADGQTLTIYQPRADALAVGQSGYLKFIDGVLASDADAGARAASLAPLPSAETV